MQIQSPYARATVALIAAGAFYAACRTPIANRLAQRVISKLPETAFSYANHNLVGRAAEGSAALILIPAASLFRIMTPNTLSSSTPTQQHPSGPTKEKLAPQNKRAPQKAIKKTTTNPMGQQIAAINELRNKIGRLATVVKKDGQQYIIYKTQQWPYPHAHADNLSQVKTNLTKIYADILRDLQGLPQTPRHRNR